MYIKKSRYLEQIPTATLNRFFKVILRVYFFFQGKKVSFKWLKLIQFSRNISKLLNFWEAIEYLRPTLNFRFEIKRYIIFRFFLFENVKFVTQLQFCNFFGGGFCLPLSSLPCEVVYESIIEMQLTVYGLMHDRHGFRR